MGGGLGGELTLCPTDPESRVDLVQVQLRAGVARGVDQVREQFDLGPQHLVGEIGVGLGLHV